jgi:hypothetical protein
MESNVISAEGFRAVETWIMQAKAHDADAKQPTPNDGLLLTDIPQGSIRVITEDFGIQIREHGDKSGQTLRSPRLFDPEGLALMRLLLLAGGSLTLNRKNIGNPLRLDYLRFRGEHNATCADWIEDLDFPMESVPVLRIIADTPRGRQTKAARNHLSYRRSELPEDQRLAIEFTDAGMPTKYPKSGRRDATLLALALLETNEDRLQFKLTQADYRRLLANAFELLDRHALLKNSDG